MKIVRLFFVIMLVYLVVGCSGSNGRDITLEEAVYVFETLVWEMHDNDGITEERVSEILGMETTEDPNFIAVRVADTGTDDFDIYVAWRRNRNDVFSNASLVINVPDFQAPLSVTKNDLMPYTAAIDTEIRLEYFETLLGRSGVITDYMFGRISYRWWTSDFTVTVDVDGDLNVLYVILDDTPNDMSNDVLQQ